MHNIYFTRHGETVWNVENKICGMTDSPLTARGQQQARQLGERLAREASIQRVYSSGMRRARATSPACGSSALANTRARPGTARSSASPRPTLPTAMTAAKA